MATGIHPQDDGKAAVDAGKQLWCSNGFEIACENGARVRIPFSLDCCDREVRSWVGNSVGTNMPASIQPCTICNSSNSKNKMAARTSTLLGYSQRFEPKGAVPSGDTKFASMARRIEARE